MRIAYAKKNSNEPKNTICIHNLNQNVTKEEMERSLYQLLLQFGTILKIVAMETKKMRGQAFVIFQDLVSATNALRAMQGYTFYDKPMQIAYSKRVSDEIAKIKKRQRPVHSSDDER